MFPQATCPAVSLSSMHGVSLRLGLPLSSHPSFSSPSSSSVTSFGDKKRGYGFVVSASTETSLAQTGVIFKPFEEVKKEDFMIPISRQISLARQRYHDECEAAINEQINVEYNVSYVYRAMYAYFDRDNVALKGLAKFFKESSDEEREMGSLIFIPALLLSGQTHVKVAYTPRGNFSLRNFHHAVNNLPTDAFLPEFNGSGALSCCDMKLTSILSNEFLYSCGGHEKDIARKVILISSCVVENLDSVMKDTLMDAADNYVSVEFLLLEQQSSHLGDLSEKISNFVKQISDLENCSFHAYLPDAQVLCGLVKRWLQELKDDMDEPLQAHFVFKSNFFCSLNLISCNLSASSNHIIDEFSSCQTCRCHGIPLDNAFGQQTKRPSCPVTGNDLETFSLIENSVKVGEHTILFLPSFQNCVKLQHVSLPVDLNVIERTNLGSLSEGVILGTSFIVTPSAFHESDDIDKSELNTQRLCSALHSLDQGLVCSSKCNIETMKESLFHCYYILLPSEKGPMLLRRLAGSEENLPFPDVSQLVGSSATIEIENSIRTSLLKMEVRDYNPFLHERGFHQKLNLLVKESLQFRSVCPNLKEVNYEPNSTQRDSSEEAKPSKPKADVVVIEEEIPQLDLTMGENRSSTCITEEWEQLIISEAPNIYSPTCISKPKLDQLVLSSQDGSRQQLDEKTSRILERLEVPRELKRKTPPAKSSITATAFAPTKAPLIPFQPVHGTDQGTTSSQPMKPNFPRLKRKQR